MKISTLYKAVLILGIICFKYNANAMDQLCIVYNIETSKFNIDTSDNNNWCNQIELGIYSNFINKLILPNSIIINGMSGSSYFKIIGKNITILRSISDELGKEIIKFYKENNFEFDSVFIRMKIPEVSIKDIYAHYKVPEIDSTHTELYSKTNINYRSFITVDNNLFAINDSGKIVVWDINKHDTIHFPHNDTAFRYSSLAKNKLNEIFLATNKGEIYKFSPKDYDFQKFLSLKKPYFICDIFINSKNQIFLIVPYVVYDPIKNKYWKNFTHHKNGMVFRKKMFFGLLKKKTNKYFEMPDYSFIDNEDRIWMIKSYGEFGGDIQIFDAKNKKCLNSNFTEIKAGLFPKSVFEDNNKNIYLTSGLQHFSNSGDIYKIDTNNYVSKIFDGKDYEPYYGGELFIGSGAYNNLDNSIYFATTYGFFKTDIQSLENHKMPQFLFRPNLKWNREPLAIGCEMSIKRLEFTEDNKLIFLTANNGIGIYDGKKVILLK